MHAKRVERGGVDGTHAWVIVNFALYNAAALLGARFRSNESALLGGGMMGGAGGADGEGDASVDLDLPPGVNMGRRRSRAVLYQLSGHYKPEKVKTKMKMNNVRWEGVTAAKSERVF